MTYDHLIPWTAQEILAATTGELLCGDRNRLFTEVSIDSRKISPSDVFVAIIGDVHDGHTFVKDVIHQGISGLRMAQHKGHRYCR
jgi:UDP-N-acetylmuramoyl-tripeptide--D-alanyl-D-alanine ligase